MAEAGASGPRSRSPISRRERQGGHFCGAIGCRNARYKPSCKRKPFFTFPTDDARCQQWIQNSGRQDLLGLSAVEIVKKGVRLCSDHFESSQYTVPAERKRLVWNAVPTVFNVPNASSLVTPKRKAICNTLDELLIPRKKHKAVLAENTTDIVSFPIAQQPHLNCNELKKNIEENMKSSKETDNSMDKMRMVEEQGAADESLSECTGIVACLVCQRPFKTTNSSLIPNLPFCKECKKYYFTLMANGSKSDSLMSLPSQQVKCPKRGQCVIDYRYSIPKEWCSSCHLQKFQTILRRFDTLQVNTGCDQTVEKPCHNLTAQGNPNLNPVIFVKKLTNQDLAEFGIKAPEVSTSDDLITGEDENHVPHQLKSKSTSDILPRHLSFPLTKQIKRRKKWALSRKKPHVTHPSMKSIDIYVFDCGHACTVCNSGQAKEWLKDCGFHTTSPSSEDAIHPNGSNCTKSPSHPVEDRGSALPKQQSDKFQPENTMEPHTHSHTVQSDGTGVAIFQNQTSQAGGPHHQVFLPVLMPVGLAPNMPNSVLFYGNVPLTVQPLTIHTAYSAK